MMTDSYHPNERRHDCLWLLAAGFPRLCWAWLSAVAMWLSALTVFFSPARAQFFAIRTMTGRWQTRHRLGLHRKRLLRLPGFGVGFCPDRAEPAAGVLVNVVYIPHMGIPHVDISIFSQIAPLDGSL